MNQSSSTQTGYRDLLVLRVLPILVRVRTLLPLGVGWEYFLGKPARFYDITEEPHADVNRTFNSIQRVT